jgi:predicted RNase H-like HicB family nuclease
MKYVIDIKENEEPNAIRYWATVQGLDGCFVAEDSLDDLLANAPDVIKVFIETSNEDGAQLPLPSEFEFRRLVHAQAPLPIRRPTRAGTYPVQSCQ